MTTNEATTAQINYQLDIMISKLRNKVGQEVKQRIENQRNLSSYLSEVGNEVSDRLMMKFDKQMQNLVSDLDKFEVGLTDWEHNMQISLSQNNGNIIKFDVDISQ